MQSPYGRALAGLYLCVWPVLVTGMVLVVFNVARPASAFAALLSGGVLTLVALSAGPLDPQRARAVSRWPFSTYAWQRNWLSLVSGVELRRAVSTLRGLGQSTRQPRASTTGKP